MRIVLITLLLLIAFVIGASAWVLSSGRVHETVRTTLVQTARQQLNREVAVGSVRGDPFRGVVLEEVAIAKRDRLAGGTLFVAQRVEVYFDLARLALDLLTNRGPLASITHLQLVSPQLVVERNAAWRWNILDLFPQRKGGPPGLPSFRPAIGVQDGLISLTDLAGRPNRPFVARFEDVDGTADLGRQPIVTLNVTMISLHGSRRSPVGARGRVSLTEGTIDLDISADDAPVDQWGPYIIRLPRVALGVGTFDGVFHLLTTRVANRLVLDYSGTLRLHDAGALLLPERAIIRRVNGLLQVDNVLLQTNDLRLTIDGSPVRLRGEVAMPLGGRADLVMSSGGMDLATLRRLLFPGAPLRLVGRAGGEVRVTGPLSAPTVSGSVVGARGRFNQQTFARGSASLSYFGNLLSLEDFLVTADGGSVAGDLRLSIGASDLVLAAEGQNVAPAVLRRAGIPLAFPLEGKMTGSAVLGLTDGHRFMEALGSVESGAIRGIAFDHLQTAFWYADGEVLLPFATAARGAARVHLGGRVAAEGDLNLDLWATGLDIRLVAAEAGVPRATAGRVAGTLSADGHVAGTLSSPVFDGTAATGAGRVGALTFDSAVGPVRVTRVALETRGLLVRQGTGVYRVAGSARWAAPAALNLGIRAEAIPASRLVGAARLPVDVVGQVSGTVSVRGTPSRPTAQGTVTMTEAGIEGQRVEAARADFRWVGGTLLLDRVEAKLAQSLVTASGRISPGQPLRIDFQAQGFRLQDLTLFPPEIVALGGTVNLRGEIRGSARDPLIAATLTSSDLALNGHVFDRAEGTVRWKRPRLELAPLTLTDDGERYAVTGAIRLEGPVAFDLHGEVTDGRVATLLEIGRVRLPFPVEGRLTGQLSLGGTLAHPSGTLRASLREGRLGEHRIDQGDIDVTLADDTLTVRRLEARAGAGLIAARGRLAVRGNSELEVGGTDLELDLLRPLLGINRRLAGRLNFTMQLSGPTRDPEVGLSVDIRNGGIDGLTFDSLVANAFYKDGQFNIEEALLTEDGHRVKGQGFIPFNPALRTFSEGRPMRIEVALDEANLSLLSLLTPQVQQADGRLEGGVVLAGTPRAPEMTGRLVVRDGRIKLRSLTNVLESVQADLAFAQDRLTINTLTARLGDGRASLTGHVSVSEFRPSGVDLRLVAENARIDLKPWYTGLIDADLTLAGRLNAPAAPPEMRGRVMLKEGIVAVRNTARGEGGQAAVSRAPNIRFRDVQVLGGRDLAVHLGGLRIDLEEGSELLVGGTLREPRLDGEWRAARGNLTVFGQTFQLLEGRAEFVPHLGFTPLISARAETQVVDPTGGTTRIFLEVNQATPDEIADRLVLTSDPPLSRQEIVALLAHQAGFAQLVGGRVETALRVELSRVLFGEVGQTIARALRLQEFTITYDFEKPLQLRIGKLLVRDLFMTLTTVFEEKTRFIWALEWRFARNTMLTLNVDNYGRLDTLVFYRIRF